ncbi:MAG: Rrf2 family transcriptional regulator [Planctomycetes bacterium]|nr:Rrf2 family transcriptional regulator [Planctomycetota bacterium]
MLTLTKKTEYALIAACHLANVGQEVVSARDMAETYGVRLPLLMNVLKKLNQHGILRSVRGARGGYALAMGPKQVSLSRLIEAVEGPPRLVKCALPQPDDPKCELSGGCPVSGPMGKVHRVFGGFLKGVTIADVAFDDRYAGRKSKDSRRAGGR